MCGIAGYSKNFDCDPSLITQMIQRIQHRGPDDLGYYNDEQVSLAHARLSIIDLSVEANQPFYADEGRFVMVYNGEVYNFQELALKMNYQARTKSDTEIVLQAYIHYGDDFVHELNGMFAIAIYDKERKELKLFRDRFGIKPIYYYWNGQQFAFASELKSLLLLPFKREIDEVAVKNYLFLEYIPQPNTIFKNFFKLGHGQRLLLKEETLTLETYYDILDKVGQVNKHNHQDHLEDFTELFEQSIRYRQIADVPLGAFLSGGTDSSAVCLALSSQTEHLSSFNIGFPNKSYDESGYADKVASELKLKHHKYELTSDDLLEDFDVIFDHYDEPFAVSSVFPSFKVCALAKKHISVALSGDGGDELFMGYGHYNWYRRLKKVNSAFGKNIRHLGYSALEHLPSKYARISSLLDYESLENDWPHVWSQDQYMFSEAEISRLTGQSYQHAALRHSWKEIQKTTTDPYLQLSLFDLKHYLPDDLLYKVDIASMANSLEVRLPFLDHHLVEHVLNYPTDVKIRKGEQKYLLKKYLEKSLSKELIYRKKWGFGAPVDEWMQNGLKNTLETYLSRERVLKCGLVEPALVQSMLKDFFKGKHFLYKRLWALMVLHIWFEKHR